MGVAHTALKQYSAAHRHSAPVLRAGPSTPKPPKHCADGGNQLAACSRRPSAVDPRRSSNSTRYAGGRACTAAVGHAVNRCSIGLCSEAAQPAPAHRTAARRGGSSSCRTCFRGRRSRRQALAKSGKIRSLLYGTAPSKLASRMVATAHSQVIITRRAYSKYSRCL